MNRKTLGLIPNGLRISGSWSQRMLLQKQRGLPMNRNWERRHPAGEFRTNTATCRQGCRRSQYGDRFMVPMHAFTKREGSP